MRNITNKELQRMKDLMGIRKPINESNVLSSTELIKEAPNGKFYGIVRENKKYFIHLLKSKKIKYFLEGVLFYIFPYKTLFLYKIFIYKLRN